MAARGILDFDDCGMGSYLYDLCPMLGNLAGQPGDTYNPDYPALRDALLDGYRTVRPLPAEWERHLPVLMAARNANHCFWTAGLNVSINNATPIVLGQSNHPVSKAIRGLAGTVRGRARQQPTGRAARHLFRRKVATA
ncbi:MAG TPA: hypothetical protein VHC49_25030 [Mycobacteriales bacterium]|nr:hypothetical protein [Mycobacteriales bacterium]